MLIPILIPCYNNWKYVKRMIEELLNKNPSLKIILINNSSTCPDTIRFLNTSSLKVIQNENHGPWVTSSQNAHIYKQMPDKYIVTDPDLELHPDLPSNFIDILSELSDKYQTFKIGLALDISEPKTMVDSEKILAHESQFWKAPVANAPYEMYYAPIDTTFALLNKKYEQQKMDKCSIRIAGVFTAKHLPWYIRNPVYTPRENYNYHKEATHFSSFSRTFVNYFDKHNLLQKLEKELAEQTAATTSKTGIV